MGLKFKPPRATVDAEKQRIALGRIILDLFVRHFTTGGEGSIGVFTSNSRRSAKESFQYRMLGISGSVLLRMLKALEEEGFILRQKGIPGHSTKIKATTELINFLIDAGLSMDKIGCKRIWPIIWSPLKEDVEEDQKQPYERIPKEEAEGLGLKVLLKHNTILRKSDIRIGSLPLYPFEKQNRRIFKDRNGKIYGRIHGGIWQNLPSDARQFITINGQGVGEVDIASTHPLIAYSLCGYDLTEIAENEGKPYELQHSVISTVNATDREILKIGMMASLNAKSRTKAERGLWHKIRTHEDRYTGRKTLLERYRQIERQGVTCKEIISLLEDKHYRIAPWLFSDAWKSLDIYESEIALRVIDYFNEQGIPVLSIHDSFIVQHDRVQELEEVLIQAIEYVLGPFENREQLCKVKTSPDVMTLREAERQLKLTRIHREAYKERILRESRLKLVIT